MRRAVLLALVLLLPAPLSPAPVRAASSGGPVSVQSCAIGKFGTFDTTFTNVSQRDIARVTFVVESASGPLFSMYHDGPFAPGSVTTRKARPDAMPGYLEATYRCVPALIAFTDGSSWKDQDVPGDMAAAIPQTPGAQIAFSSCYAAADDVSILVSSFFTNTASQPATEVDLGFVENGSLVARDAAKGTYAPGTLIKYKYRPQTGVLADDLMHQQCVVLGVTYADGTQWRNPAPPPTAPWPAFATSGDNGHITIDSCGVDNYETGGRYWHLGYRNDGTSPVKIVDFVLVVDGRAVGTGRELHDLAPGEGLGKRQYYSAATGKLANPVCLPLRVTYADGSTWVNPAAQAATAPRSTSAGTHSERIR